MLVAPDVASGAKPDGSSERKLYHICRRCGA
jgi:hypothetical protein